MIYLIGGPPRCGKTTIARRLSKSRNIPWISADMLESVASLYVPKKDAGKYFPKSAMRKKTRQSNDLMYGKYSAKQIARSYIEQSKITYRAIKMAAEVAEKEGYSYIIEGHQVHPKIIREIVNKLGDRKVKAVVLTRFNVEDIIRGGKKHRAKSDWFMQKTNKEETYSKIAFMVAEYSRFFEKEAKKYKIKIINTDDGFITQIGRAVDYLK